MSQDFVFLLDVIDLLLYLINRFEGDDKCPSSNGRRIQRTDCGYLEEGGRVQSCRSYS